MEACWVGSASLVEYYGCWSQWRRVDCGVSPAPAAAAVMFSVVSRSNASSDVLELVEYVCGTAWKNHRWTKLAR